MTRKKYGVRRAPTGRTNSSGAEDDSERIASVAGHRRGAGLTSDAVDHQVNQRPAIRPERSGSHDVRRRSHRRERDDAVRGVAPRAPGNQGGPDGGPPLRLER